LKICIGYFSFTLSGKKECQIHSCGFGWVHQKYIFTTCGEVMLYSRGVQASECPLYQGLMTDEPGVVGEIRIGRGNRNNRRKPAPVPVHPPQILHEKNPNQQKVHYYIILQVSTRLYGDSRI
jgi:hypothetical protein